MRGGAWIVVALAAGCALADATPSTYARLHGTRYAVRPVDVPDGGVEIKQDLASFRIESGAFRPMEPAADTVTGFIFQGKGRFRFEVPNAFELAQLRRFTRDHDITAIDTAFTTLIVRRSSAVTPPFAMTFPEHDISFLHGIAPIGDKFLAPAELGPQGQKHAPEPVVALSIPLTVEAKAGATWGAAH